MRNIPNNNISKTKVLSINKKIALVIAQFGILIGVATIAPLFHNQPITGPIVNATLFLGVIFVGTQNAILIGLIPSMIALSVGLLPAPLAPMVPFIMLSNVILILTFGYLRKKNFWLGIITASAVKFIFLYSTSFIVVNLIVKKPIALKAAAMLSWPQLLTALAGGIIAWFVLKAFKKC